MRAVSQPCNFLPLPITRTHTFWTLILNIRQSPRSAGHSHPSAGDFGCPVSPALGPSCQATPTKPLQSCPKTHLKYTCPRLASYMPHSCHFQGSGCQQTENCGGAEAEAKAKPKSIKQIILKHKLPEQGGIQNS